MTDHYARHNLIKAAASRAQEEEAAVAKQTAELREIPQLTGTLEAQMKAMFDLAERLESKLNPVLHSVPKSAECVVANKEDRVASTPLGAELAGVSSQLVTLHYRLRTIYDRLEL